MAPNKITKSTPVRVKCGDRACTTEHVSLSTKDTARKVSSHFFGRNKNATKAIDFHVWHHLCRITYQRRRYASQKLGQRALCQFYLDHLLDQFIRIRLWRPDSAFTVQLWESAKKRLARYHSAVLRGSSKDSAKQQVAVHPGTSKKGDKPKPRNEAEAISIDHAEYIDQQLAGTNKNIDYIVDTVIPWIQQEINNGAMVQMPPIEFLINSPAEGETIIDPLTNYARWEAYTDGREYGESAIAIAATPPCKLPRLKRLFPPRSPIKLNLSLARFRASSSSSEKAPSTPSEDKNKHSTADKLSLHEPPSPSVLAASKRGDKKRKLSIDTTLANQDVERPAAQPPSSSSSHQSDSSFTLVKGTPIMARGMVFAGGKPKHVLKKQCIDVDLDDEFESESGSDLRERR